MFFLALGIEYVPSLVQEMEWEVSDGRTWEVPDEIDNNAD